MLTALLFHARLLPASTPEAFLRGIVFNLGRAAQKRPGRSWIDLDELDDDDAPVSTEPEAGRRLAQAKRHALLEQLLDRLPPLQAAVLRHMDIEGLTSEQTAKRLGRTLTWVATTRKRTLTHLRRVFLEADPECCLFWGRSLHW